MNFKRSTSNDESSILSPASQTGKDNFIIQRKLSIGAVNDPLEHEANAMADKVMRMPEPNFIQRKCAHGEEEGKAQRKTLASFIQKKELSNSSIANDAISSQIQSTKGSGNRIPESTKSFMESRFGADFSNVHIHSDNHAAQLSKELNAQAFTAGNDIYFNKGKYQPESNAGKHLLAHELTHTIQQIGISAHSDGSIQKADNNGLDEQAGGKKTKPGEKDQVTSPGRQTVKENEGIKFAVSTGIETETKREDDKTKTDGTGKFAFEMTIPFTDKLQLGPVSFFKEGGVKGSLNRKLFGGASATSLELESSFKLVSLDWEKVKVPLGFADFGLSASLLSGVQYNLTDKTASAKLGFAAEGEAKFKPGKQKWFYITVKGGVEKTYDKEGKIEFKSTPLKWKTSLGVGVEF